jgi:SAM-dependent methyltransferase
MQFCERIYLSSHGYIRMLPPSDFNEEEYLAANPDVAAAVRTGACPSGAEHYALYGIHENRSLSRRITVSPEGPRASRRDRILAWLDFKSLEGLEIGALASPLVLPSEGHIFFVDHADTETLRGKYVGHSSVDLDKIVKVDAVWGSQTLQDCLGPDRKVDYVLASHVIEHVPDLVTWLSEIRSVLRPSGTLRLAVPDRRFTFDYLRPESRIYDVLDAYIRRARVPLPRVILENHYLSREVNCDKAWNDTLVPAELRPYNTIEAGLRVANDVLANGSYHDTHCWVFTPTSFAELFAEIAQLGLLPFACDFCFDTRRNEFEFFVSMSPKDNQELIVRSWQQMKLALDRGLQYFRAKLTLPVSPDEDCVSSVPKSVATAFCQGFSSHR